MSQDLLLEPNERLLREITTEDSQWEIEVKEEIDHLKLIRDLLSFRKKQFQEKKFQWYILKIVFHNTQYDYCQYFGQTLHNDGYVVEPSSEFEIVDGDFIVVIDEDVLHDCDKYTLWIQESFSADDI